MLQLFHILIHLITVSCGKHCNLLHGEGAPEAPEELFEVVDSCGSVTHLWGCGYRYPIHAPHGWLYTHVHMTVLIQYMGLIIR